MPLDQDGFYVFPGEFKKHIKQCLSLYLRPDSAKQARQYYAEICYLLHGIERDFYKDYSVGTHEGLTQFARTEIVRKLTELRGKYEDDDSGEWINNFEGAAKKIWSIWRHERECCPRAGIILLYLDPSGSIEILLTSYMKGDEIQYGFVKGKIEYGENSRACAARESEEEIDLDRNWVYEQIENVKPIKKNIYDLMRKSVIEHYYYIILVWAKDIRLRPNGTEITGCEWHNIFTVKCSPQCLGKDLVPSTEETRKSNYFMVNCTDCYDRTSLIQDILECVDDIKGNDSASKNTNVYINISLNIEFIVLCTIN